MKTPRFVWNFRFVTLALTLLLTPLAPLGAQAGELGFAIPEPNTVTMVDLGAKSCVPCKMMAPIIEKLEAEYAGKAAIRFVDVWENPEKKAEYNVSAIPTQIFYDKKGKERRRHVGFLDEESIRKVLNTLMAE